MAKEDVHIGLRRRVEETVGGAERAFNICWSTFVEMKEFQSDVAHVGRMLDFQPQLCKALLDLDRLYSELSLTRKSLLRHKKRYNSEWLRGQLRFIGRAQNTLEYAIGVGKTLGDAFAWFWYRDAPRLLEQHANQPRQVHLPSGIGGIGELEFIRIAKAIGPHLVIYHGTTTILRLGDVSFVNLQDMTISGLGELKTWAVDASKLQLRMTIVGSPIVDSAEATLERAQSIPSQSPLLPRTQAQLDRQVKRMTEAIASGGGSHRPEGESLGIEVQHSELAQAIQSAKRGRFTFHPNGRGSLLVCYKSAAKTLYSRASAEESPDLSAKLRPVAKHTARIVRRGSSRNHIRVAGILYHCEPSASHLLGALPILWFPLPAHVLKQLLFREVDVTNVFNPAHLIHELEEAGCEFTGTGLCDLAIRRRGSDGREVYLTGLGYYFAMAHGYLWSDDAVKRAILRSLEVAERSGIESGGRIDIRIHHLLTPQVGGEWLPT